MWKPVIAILSAYLSFSTALAGISESGLIFPDSEINLDTDTPVAAYSYSPQISSDTSGHVYVVWRDNRNGYSYSDISDIYFNYSSDYGRTWQASDIRLDTDGPGAAGSYEPQISSDTSGHVYVVWEDTRNGSPDVYFNYSSDYGATWQTSDVRLDTDASGTADSQYPRISSDTSGHVYVVWRDNRNGYYYPDIYFNYSSDYGRTWQTTDIRLNTTHTAGAPSSYYPQISSDESGHVYAVWEDDRSGWGDIYFNYSGDYGATWQTNDIRLDTDAPGAAHSYEPQISSDTSGHVYAVWEDDRSGWGDIYFNYSSDYGRTWQTNDIRLDTDAPGTAHSFSPQISSDASGHIYVVWNEGVVVGPVPAKGSSDYPAGRGGIYFNYSSDYGSTWQISDIRLDTDAPGTASSYDWQISSDGSGHVYVVWLFYNGDYYIYFKYSSDYGRTWQFSDMRLNSDAAETSYSYNLQISSDGNGSVYVVWQDWRNVFTDIYFNYSSDYGRTWQTNDIRLEAGGQGAAASYDPQISSNANGHVYAVWVDSRNGWGQDDIYFNYSSDYGRTWQTTDTRLNTDAIIGAKSWSPQISSDENGNVYVVWQDYRNSWDYPDIHFNYSSDYGRAWQASDVRLDTDAPGAASSYNPQISSDVSGHVYVVWEDYRNGGPDIYFNYSSDYGATWQTNDIRLDTDAPGAAPSYNPRIRGDGNGHVYAVWEDDRSGWGDIYFNYSSDYGRTWQANDMRLDSAPGPTGSSSPEISSDGNGSVYVVWRDWRNVFTDIYFNYSRDYGRTWQTSDARLDADAPRAQDSYHPKISSDTNGHVYVVWYDFRNLRVYPDVYFNYSSDYGRSWQANDLRLTDPAGPEYSYFRSILGDVNVSSDDRGYVYVVWADNRSDSNGDIYLNYSSDYGKNWQANDMRLDTDAPGAAHSYEPQISSDGGGHVYVAWTDGRNGLADIYFKHGISVTCQICDANEDSSVDIGDIIFALGMSVAHQQPPGSLLQCVDKNSDGAINVLDQIGCLRKILGLE